MEKKIAKVWLWFMGLGVVGIIGCGVYQYWPESAAVVGLFTLFAVTFWAILIVNDDPNDIGW